MVERFYLACEGGSPLVRSVRERGKSLVENWGIWWEEGIRVKKGEGGADRGRHLLSLLDPRGTASSRTGSLGVCIDRS